MKKIFTLAVFILSLPFLHGQSNPSVDWCYGMTGNVLGTSGIILSDLDGNGYDDIISVGNYFGGYWEKSYFFTVMEYSPAQHIYVQKWISNIIKHVVYSLQVYDFDGDGTKEIYLGLDDGTIAVYNSHTFEKVRTIPVTNDSRTPGNIYCMEFGDANNDSFNDMVVTNGDSTWVLDNEYHHINSIPYGAMYFKIGNVDSDSENEIVYSSGKIVQLKNGNTVLKNTFITSNSNAPVLLARMNQDEVQDVIFSSGDTIFVYDFRSNVFIWSRQYRSDQTNQLPVTGLWLYDYDGDGICDVFAGNFEWDGVYCHNGKDGHLDFSLVNYTREGVVNAGMGDLDKDGRPEIIWCAGAETTASDFFFVYDLATKTREWQSRFYSGGFQAFDIGDVNNDGKTELVLAALGTYHKYYNHELLTVFDAESKTVEWQNDAEMLNVDVEDVTAARIGDADMDGKNELLLGVEGGYAYTYILILDSAMHVKRYIQVMGMNNILGMEIADVDKDGLNELVVTCGTNVSGSSSPEDWKNYIYIFVGASGNIKWQSPLLGGVGSNIGSLKIGDIDNDGNPEIVALKYGSPVYGINGKLIVIDGVTHEMTMDQSRNYTALDVADLYHSGKPDLVAAADTGKIIILDGSTLLAKHVFHTSCGNINGLRAYDMNNDGVDELVIADNYTLNFYDIKDSTLRYRSDSINSLLAMHNSMKVGNFDSDNKTEIYINANHALYCYKTDYKSLGIDERLSDAGPVSLKLYPNPVSKNVTLEFEPGRNADVLVKIYNMTGREVFTRNYGNAMPGVNKIEINTGNYQSGIYEVVVLTGTKVSEAKMIRL